MKISGLMIAIRKYALVLLLSLSLGLILTACDSSSSGGGGTTTDTGGYTQEDLAKQWVVTETGTGWVSNGWVTFDAVGQFTQWLVGGFSVPPISGALTVSPSGRVTGSAVKKFVTTIATYPQWQFRFYLQFQADGTIRGSITYTTWLVTKATGDKVQTGANSFHWLLRPKSN